MPDPSQSPILQAQQQYAQRERQALPGALTPAHSKDFPTSNPTGSQGADVIVITDEDIVEILDQEGGIPLELAPGEVPFDDPELEDWLASIDDPFDLY
ncbi:MAG TPA: hypothetical protein DCE41_24690 [Cytophagales bacterium]|nr:hypothetical protein [Cytophagales bacterium]HAA22733.1 hypothetical protein [Cytophagales bacterium]HAP60312.1 hypothetical protein [Cytophagales bacterium]